MTRPQDAGRRAQGAGHGATDAEIDHAIDVVARQMTEGSPESGADFRRRVLTQIEAGQAPRTAWRAAWVLSPLAAAAAIVMAIFVARGLQLRDRGSDSIAPQEAVTRSAAPQPPTVLPEQFPVRLKPDATVDGPDTTVSVEKPDTTVSVRLKPDATIRLDATIREDTAIRAATNRAAAATGLLVDAEAIEALAAPSLDLVPLAIDALAPDPIQLERLDTTSPITIAPITVAPIDITDVQRR